MDPRKGWLFAECIEFLSAPGSFLPVGPGHRAETAPESASGERREAVSASNASSQGPAPRRTIGRRSA
jgi:hypothetical protein